MFNLIDCEGRSNNHLHTFSNQTEAAWSRAGFVERTIKKLKSKSWKQKSSCVALVYLLLHAFLVQINHKYCTAHLRCKGDLWSLKQENSAFASNGSDVGCLNSTWECDWGGLLRNMWSITQPSAAWSIDCGAAWKQRDRRAREGDGEGSLICFHHRSTPCPSSLPSPNSLMMMMMMMILWSSNKSDLHFSLNRNWQREESLKLQTSLWRSPRRRDVYVT